jgi:hypothetical protein
MLSRLLLLLLLIKTAILHLIDLDKLEARVCSSTKLSPSSFSQYRPVTAAVSLHGIFKTSRETLLGIVALVSLQRLFAVELQVVLNRRRHRRRRRHSNERYKVQQ